MRLFHTPIRDYVHTVEAVVNHAGVRDQSEPVATKPFEPDTPLPTINPLILIRG